MPRDDANGREGANAQHGASVEPSSRAVETGTSKKFTMGFGQCDEGTCAACKAASASENHLHSVLAVDLLQSIFKPFKPNVRANTTAFTGQLKPLQ